MILRDCAVDSSKGGNPIKNKLERKVLTMAIQGFFQLMSRVAVNIAPCPMLSLKFIFFMTSKLR